MLYYYLPSRATPPNFGVKIKGSHHDTHTGWHLNCLSSSPMTSEIGSFGCMSKDLMVLVSLKKSLTFHFARVCLYFSLRPLMHGMTILAPSMNCTMDGFGFLVVFVGVFLLEITVMVSGCLVGLYEGDPFLLQGIQV